MLLIETQCPSGHDLKSGCVGFSGTAKWQSVYQISLLVADCSKAATGFHVGATLWTNRVTWNWVVTLLASAKLARGQSVMTSTLVCARVGVFSFWYCHDKT